MSAEPSFPLHWPVGWKRTQYRDFGKFGEGGRGVSMTTALNFLEGEMRRLGASNPVISTNVQVRLDGRPYANQSAPSDPGAAVYFTLKGKRLVLACDKWNKPATNLYAIGLHIEAMRGQQRWGVGSIEQAFGGYAALPERRGPSPWEILGVGEMATEEGIMSAWRGLAKTCHPDAGGSVEKMALINEAKDNALATLRARGGRL